MLGPGGGQKINILREGLASLVDELIRSDCNVLIEEG